jgi:hypothetical protein
MRCEDISYLHVCLQTHALQSNHEGGPEYDALIVKMHLGPLLRTPLAYLNRFGHEPFRLVIVSHGS